MQDLNSILLAQLKTDEGLSLTVYECTAGFLTIGYGRNLETRGITKKEAELLLNNDIEIAQQETVLVFPKLADLSKNRQAVLINMCFNLGKTGLGNFKRMLAALDAKDFERAADEMLDSKWAHQVGLRARRLANIMRAG